MDLQMTKREKFFMFNSLLCLAKALEKRYTTIDLRNETCVTGKISEVDGYMNIVLNDVALYDSEGNYQYFQMLFLQARNIRNIHIPDNISVAKIIKKQVTVQKKPVNKASTRNFKQTRARKQQEETLKLIDQMKQEKRQQDKSSSDK